MPNGFGKLDRHGVANLPGDAGVGAVEDVIVGKALQRGRFAKGDAAVLHRMGVASVGYAGAPAREGPNEDRKSNYGSTIGRISSRNREAIPK